MLTHALRGRFLRRGMHDITVTSTINKFHVFTSIYVISRESNNLYEQIPESVLIIRLLLTEWDNRYPKILKLVVQQDRDPDVP